MAIVRGPEAERGLNTQEYSWENSVRETVGWSRRNWGSCRTSRLIWGWRVEWGKMVEVIQIPVIQGKHRKTERGCLGAPCLQGKDWPQHIGCPLSRSGRNSPPFWSGRRHQSSVLRAMVLRPPSLWVAGVWGTFSGSLYWLWGQISRQTGSIKQSICLKQFGTF